MLEHGEAYFDVVHDAQRPFVVIAGNRRITDIGTKFSVRRDGDDVKVIVTEGRVRVDIVDTGHAAAPVYAVGGNVVVAKSDETLVANASAKELDDQLSWRTDMLEFHQDTLADAAVQFNRYNQGSDRGARRRGATFASAAAFAPTISTYLCCWCEMP